MVGASARTSVSQTCGSTRLSLAVSIGVEAMAADLPPPSACLSVGLMLSVTPSGLPIGSLYGLALAPAFNSRLVRSWPGGARSRAVNVPGEFKTLVIWWPCPLRRPSWA